MPSVGATNIFNLGSGFEVQNSSTPTTFKVVKTRKGNSNGACMRRFEETVNATATYKVCGTPTLQLSLGGVVNGFIIVRVTATHEAGEDPEVVVEGTAYDGNETVRARTFAISHAFTEDVVGQISGMDATQTTHVWELQLATGMGGNGQIKFANPHSGDKTYTEEGLGSFASEPSIEGYECEEYTPNDDNQELNTYSATFTKMIDLTEPA